MKEQKEDQVLTGSISYRWIPKIYSTCPYCGAFPTSYRLNRYIKWDESVHFECGLSVYNKTSTHYDEIGKCKHSKEWKKLKKGRLKQVEVLEKNCNEIIKDKKLSEEFVQFIEKIKRDIERWWYN